VFVPGRVLGSLLGLGAAGLGEGEPLAAFGLLGGDQALVLEQLQGRVDRAGARPPDAAGAALQLLDHLVAVHGALDQQGEHRLPDVGSASTPAASMRMSPAVTAVATGGREGRREAERAKPSTLRVQEGLDVLSLDILQSSTYL